MKYCGKSGVEYIKWARVLTLADLPDGTSATVLKIEPAARGIRKFADIGIVSGTDLTMQTHAPFGGLLRVKFMDTSMALHSDDAKNIIVGVC